MYCNSIYMYCKEYIVQLPVPWWGTAIWQGISYENVFFVDFPLRIIMIVNDSQFSLYFIH